MLVTKTAETMNESNSPRPGQSSAGDRASRGAATCWASATAAPRMPDSNAEHSSRALEVSRRCCGGGAVVLNRRESRDEQSESWPEFFAVLGGR